MPDVSVADDVVSADTSGTSVDGAECSATDDPGCGADLGEIPVGNLPNLLAGNPINVLSGNKHQKEVDFAIPGGKLKLQRTYNSQNAGNNIGLGQGWHHSFAVSLHDGGDGQLEVVQSNGSRLYFSTDTSVDAANPVFRGSYSNEGYLIKRGRYHEWHLSDGRTLRFRGSYLVSIDWRDQQRLELFYSDGRVATVTDETGRILRFDYYAGTSSLSGYDETQFGEAPGHLSGVTLPDGSRIEYDYDHNRNLTRARYADGTNREFHYENTLYPNNLTGVTDRTEVRYSTWRYDDSGRAVSSELANGTKRISIDYPDLAEVDSGDIVSTRVTNALGQLSTYTWKNPPGHARPQLISSEGVACTTCPPTGFDYSYDESGQLLSKTRTGQGTAIGDDNERYVYDDEGRIVETWRSDTVSREQLIERLEYDALELQPVRRFTPSINPDAEQVIEIERDEQGLPLVISKRGFTPQLDVQGTPIGFAPIERVTRFGYENSRLISVDGPREDVDDTVHFEWDSFNRMTTIKLPDNPPMRITEFDSMGRAIQFIRGGSSGGSSTPVTFTYDNESRVKSVTHLGRTLRLRYDAEGRLTGVVNRVGREMEFRYDDAGQLASLEYVGGQRLTQDRDDEGRVVEQRLMDQYGEMIRSVSAFYDAQGRAATVSRAANITGTPEVSSATIDYVYDQHNRAIQAKNRFNGATIDFKYNDSGGLSGVENSAGKQINLGYDVAGHHNSLTDPRGNKFQFIADDFDQVVAATSTDTGTSTYKYDAAGNRTQWTNAEGSTTVYTWNAANRPIRIENDGDITWFEYDADTGRLAATGNDATTERYRYTRDAQLLRHERIIDDRIFVTEYQYDDKGRMIGRKLPDGQSLRYHYYQDDQMLGRLRAVTRSSMFGLKQEVLLAEIDEDPSDGTTGYLAFNGKRTTRTHAADGSVTRIEVSDTLTLDYRYDENGRIIGIDENGISQNYAYTNGYLSSANTIAGNFVFDYDVSGNRTGKSVIRPDGQQSDTRYDYAEIGTGNRLQAKGELSGQASEVIEYNNSGSPVLSGSLRYEYNHKQRPIRVYKNDALLAEYSYNSFGERIKKVSYRNDQKRVTYFLYDGHRISAVIPENADSSIEHTLYLDGHPVIQLLGQSTYAIHTDRLGTSHALSDETGGIAWQAEYSPFGRATVLIDNITFNHRLPGHYEDSETGTHYNYLRDYDPDTGRYLTSDPISIAGGLNTYLYANADPLNSVDVLGLRPDDSAGIPEIISSSGTHINEAEYLQLHGYANSGDVQDQVRYFQMLFQLTDHGIYNDFADSYSGGFTTPVMALLRDMFLSYGTNNIEQVGCAINREDGGIYLIPEVGVFSSIIFNAQGIGRETTEFVTNGVTGLWSFGVGTVNFAFDSTFGHFYDVQNLLADQFGVDFLRTPEWAPSYQNAVATSDELINLGIDIGVNILVNHDLIWQGIVADYSRQWAERRYGEAITGPFLEIASLFTGGGLVLRAQRAVDALVISARADTVNPGQLDFTLNQLIGEFRGDPDALRGAADRAGLRTEVDARLALIGNCSFAEDTLVLTDSGYLKIKDISAGVDRVWAKDEHTGQMGWQEVLAHYSNRYEETVHVTAVDSIGDRQTIRSNRIHPYFARLAAGAVMASASAVMSPAIATEGYIYQGDIAGGAWVDAQHLKAGDELLGDAGQWLRVERIIVEDQSLEAWNLSVGEYATYFVAGDEDATAVWVHNNCPGNSFDVGNHQQAITDARALLLSGPKRSGTAATAEVDIPGIPNRLNGHSRIGDPTPELQAQGFVGQGNRNFTYNDSPTADGHITDGSTHAEYRILDNIAERLGSNTQATGRIDLFVELPPCAASCGGPGGVIAQFRDRYPNIELNVQHNNSIRLTP